MHGVEKPASGAQTPVRAASEIAFFVRALDGGGASRDAIALANALADQGRIIAVLTLDGAWALAVPRLAPN